MFPAPVRVETKASFVPSGEYIGRDSVAGFVTSRCASPPVAATVQMSPPEANAISLPSGEIAGSLNDGNAVCPTTLFPASNIKKTRAHRRDLRREEHLINTYFNS